MLGQWRDGARRLRRARLARALLLTAAALTVALLFAARTIERAAAPFVSERAQALPHQRVGLLLGCSQRLGDGRPNLFFVKRIAAASALFRARKIDYLLVSGDNSRPNYDEPNDMRRALVQAGVPEASIVLDYAGFRTLDSVVRAKEVFGLTSFTVISQRFHDERAVYLARRHGIEAYGFVAADVGGADGFRVRLRELFSRAFAILDVTILDSRPHFTGPREDAFAER